MTAILHKMGMVRRSDISMRIDRAKTFDHRLSYPRMILLHLLPGALVMLLMLLASSLLNRLGLYPGVPILFVFVAPALILIQLGYLYIKGWQLNGKLSLVGVVLYRDRPLPGGKLAVIALLLFAWIAFVWFVVKPPANAFFREHFFSWMPVNFFDDDFLKQVSDYDQVMIRGIGILFILSITLGGAVEELFFRGYLLPRMEHLGGWAPVVHTLLFSLYHFWTPWENLVRLLGLFPWLFAVWRTRNLYLSLLIHMVSNLVSGVMLFSVILQLT